MVKNIKALPSRSTYRRIQWKLCYSNLQNLLYTRESKPEQHVPNPKNIHNFQDTTYYQDWEIVIIAYPICKNIPKGTFLHLRLIFDYLILLFSSKLQFFSLKNILPSFI